MKIRLALILFVLPLLAEPMRVPRERYGTFPDVRDHPGHYPFISYLTFRSLCDHIVDQTTEWFDPNLVRQGDIIYLNGWYLDWFVASVHDRIPVPYILFTGDIGGWFPPPEYKKLLYDPKLALWLCRNIVFSYHPKLIQIPTGQDLALFEYIRDPFNHLISAVVHKENVPKEHLLYMCFCPRPHGDRDKIEKLFLNQPFCYSSNNTVRPRPQFYQEIASSYFTLSPLGLETDSVRTWEALVLGSIPIVEHTFLDPVYEDLPVLMVYDWEEITEEFLKKKWDELKKFKLDKAYFDYWSELIQSFQKRVRNNDSSFAQLEATRWNCDDLTILTDLISSCHSLEYRGFLGAIRPFELAHALPHLQIHLVDPWVDEAIFSSFKLFYPSDNLKLGRPLNQSTSYFLDLTYYRMSLNIDFSTSVCQYGNFRQSLKRDLLDLYMKLERGSLIAGNCSQDPYVEKVLRIIEKERGIPIQKRGPFWWIEKPNGTLTIHELLPDPYPEVYLQTPRLDSTLSLAEKPNRALSELLENVEIAIEVGSEMGSMSRYLAQLLPEQGTLLAVYDWKESYSQFLSNIQNAEATDKVIPFRMSSLGAAYRLLSANEPIDLIYLHSQNQPLYENLSAWYPLVKNHGVLCGDQWHLPEVQKAVIDFAKQNNVSLLDREDIWMFLPSF